MNTIEIRHWAGRVLYTHTAEGATMRAAILAAVESSADLLGADLLGADLLGADLLDAVLRGADLLGADLRDAVLRGADLRDADLIIPAVERLDEQILELVEANPAALNMSSWHTCETTHCRAGWAITLAGKEGAELENRVGAAVAGALIYAKSCPGQPVPNFYAEEPDALKDMRQRVQAK